jgi:hypothetical protein
VVRKHYGFISTVIVFRWTISDKRLDPSNLDTEDGVAGEPSAPGGLHVSFDVRCVFQRAVIESVGRV